MIMPPKVQGNIYIYNRTCEHDQLYHISCMNHYFHEKKTRKKTGTHYDSANKND